MNWIKISLCAGVLTFTTSAFSQTRHTQSVRPAVANVKVLDTYTNRFKMVNKYVLVPKAITESQLIDLATKLHQAEPKTNYWLLNDGSKAVQMMRWLKDYGDGKSAATDPIFSWIADHMVANLQQYGWGSNEHWVLAKGMWSDKIADIK